MRTFKLTPLLAALATAVSANAFADTSEDTYTGPSMKDIAGSIELATYVTDRTIVEGIATSKETTSRSRQWWLNNINRPYNNQLGANNGAGVVVGVVDTGAQTDHKALNGQFAQTFNPYTNSWAITDERAHGTMVSGIIAGRFSDDSPYEGVAPGAKIAMFKAFQTASIVPDTIVSQGIRWAVDQGVPILNLSVGSASVSSFNSAIKYATDKGILVVAAMGNTGNTGKAGALWPAGFAKYSTTNNRIIAVGALNQDNTRLGISSWDPTLANWTVFAPGGKIFSSYSDKQMYNTFASMSGTSFAAPMVSGQAALIKSNWNFLNAETIAQVIFKSADRLCSNGGNGATNVTRCNIAGPDPVFGWGLINIDRSLQPIGTLTLPTTKGAIVLTNGSKLVSSKGGTSMALSKLASMAVDDYNRGFMVTLGSLITNTATTTTTSSLPTTTSSTTTAGVTGAKFSAQYAYANSQGFDAPITLGRASFSFTGKNGSGYGMGFGGTGANYFGLQSTGTAPLSLNGEAAKFNAPYFGFANTGAHAGYTMALNNTTAVRFGVIAQGNGTGRAMGFDTTNAANLSIGTVEMQKMFGNDTLVITAGNMREKNSALGMSGTGAMAVATNGNTNFMTLAGSKQVAENTYVSAMMSVGQTGGFTNNAVSFINGASSTRSQAWSLGVAQKNVFKDNDSLGVSVSMPLRTMSGSVSVTTATAQSQADGSLTYATQQVSLAPSGMQKDLEVSYTRPQFGGNLSAMVQAKFNPGHQAGAATQFGVGVRWARGF